MGLSWTASGANFKIIFKKNYYPEGLPNDLEKVWTACVKIVTITEVSKIMFACIRTQMRLDKITQDYPTSSCFGLESSELQE